MNDIERAKEYLKGCQLYRCGTVGNISAIDTAISALEKQIPKKPINDRSENESTTRCGCCNAQLVAKFKHCPRCGRRMDWSVEE